MCGIFGYLGKRRDAPRIVFEGLKRLEYRGYDSWGIALAQRARISNFQFPISNLENKLSLRSRLFSGENKKLIVEKHVGKISASNLKSKKSKILNLKSNVALGHTRWATHGGVTRANAHPHLDCTGKIAVVHNGIVENFQDLKIELENKRHKFISETDTEVIAHMIEQELGVRPEIAVEPLKNAVRRVFLRLSGLNAIVVLSDGQLIAAKNGSPLVVGIGEGEFLIASDAAAIIPHTNKVVFLKDNQMVVVLQDGVGIFDLESGKKISYKMETLDWKREEADLGKFKHFMLKEIYEQPQVLRNIAENYVEDVEKLCDLIKKARGTFLIGAGTAFHACLAGSYLFSKIAKLHVNTIIASEFNYLEDFLTKESLVIALSQSGETIDVVEPIKRAKAKGAKIAALVNNVGSTIWQMADFRILLGAGPEMAVASTKAYVAKLAVLLLTVFGLTGKPDEGRRLLFKAANEVERLLFEEIENLKKITKVLSKSEHIFTIGRGLSYQGALEAALKMKEVSYVHTEGLAGGELKHGPIALISRGTPCLVFAIRDETYEAIISNATEIKSRGGVIIGISPQKSEVFDFFVKVADLGEASIIPNVIPAQLFGYYMAIEKGLDPDKPRNLAKSVTVK